ncbi:2'-5' RNA ligase family protein [Allosphingosinicella humi]
MFGGVDQTWLEELRRTYYPPERNLVPAHLTLFHQLPPSSEAELAGRLARSAALAPPSARIAGLIDLDGGTALRIESVALEDMRADLAEALWGLLTPQDRAPWRPHVTIQNKVERAEARRLQARLAATFEPRRATIGALALWRYARGPWEPIRRYAFRG